MPTYPIEQDVTRSFVTYTANGVTTTWALTTQSGVPIKYLSKSHIKVYVDGVLQVSGTNYTWSGDGQSIVISPALTAGKVLHINRDTPATDPVVDWSASSIWRSDDLDAATLQALYVGQETLDYLIGVKSGNIALGNASTFDGLPSSGYLQTAGAAQTVNKLVTLAQGLIVGAELALPSWTTAGRPTGAAGKVGRNTTLGNIEWHDGSGWKVLLDADDLASTNAAIAAANASISNLISGATTAGNAASLGGVAANLYALAAAVPTLAAFNTLNTTVNNLLSGATKAGNADTLDGIDSTGFLQLTGAAQTVSKAVTLSQGLTVGTSLQLPAWTSAGRPSPSDGLLGFNTTLQAAEVYGAGAWNQLASPVGGYVLKQGFEAVCYLDNPFIVIASRNNYSDWGATYNRAFGSGYYNYVFDRWLLGVQGAGATVTFSSDATTILAGQVDAASDLALALTAHGIRTTVNFVAGGTGANRYAVLKQAILRGGGGNYPRTLTLYAVVINRQGGPIQFAINLEAIFSDNSPPYEAISSTQFVVPYYADLRPQIISTTTTIPRNYAVLKGKNHQYLIYVFYINSSDFTAYPNQSKQFQICSMGCNSGTEPLVFTFDYEADFAQCQRYFWKAAYNNYIERRELSPYLGAPTRATIYFPQGMVNMPIRSARYAALETTNVNNINWYPSITSLEMYGTTTVSSPNAYAMSIDPNNTYISRDPAI